MNMNAYMIYHIEHFTESSNDDVIGTATTIMDAVNICKKKARKENVELDKTTVLELIDNFRSSYGTDKNEFLIVPYILNTLI